MGNVSVILEPQPQGFLATAIGWSNCNAHGITEAEALDNLRQLLLTRLQTAKVVSLDIYDEHPLVKLSGIFKDDPQFDAMLEFIEHDRKALDQAIASVQQQLQRYLAQVELVRVAMTTEAQPEDAWDRMFGLFKGDPDFAEIAAEIRAVREVDDDSEVDPAVYES